MEKVIVRYNMSGVRVWVELGFRAAQRLHRSVGSRLPSCGHCSSPTMRMAVMNWSAENEGITGTVHQALWPGPMWKL